MALQQPREEVGKMGAQRPAHSEVHEAPNENKLPGRLDFGIKRTEITKGYSGRAPVFGPPVAPVRSDEHGIDAPGLASKAVLGCAQGLERPDAVLPRVWLPRFTSEITQGGFCGGFREDYRKALKR